MRCWPRDRLSRRRSLGSVPSPGRSSPGIANYLDRQTAYPPINATTDPQRPITKLLMVHGIGEHHPGYAGSLLANLVERWS